MSIRSISDPLRRPLRASACALAMLSVAAGLVGSQGVSEARSTGTIAAPKARQAVKGILQIRPLIESRRGPFFVEISIDGTRYDKQRSARLLDARKPVPIDTTELANGRHKLKVTVVSRGSPRRASQTLSFVVRNNRPPPAGAGQPAPTNNLNNFRLVVSEGFDVAAPPGSIVDSGSPLTTVYTGATGTAWRTYPSKFFDTFLRHPYRPAEVLSVHDSALDFWLHPVGGKNSGASVSPILPGGSQYQTYGRYSARVRIGNAPLSQYLMAFLLWPQNDKDFLFSESDYPENQLLPGRVPVTGYSHHGVSGANKLQEYIISAPVDLRDWHVYTQEWLPGLRRYYLDGRLIGKTVEPVWAGPMRWQIQIQSYLEGEQSGHLYVDWAAIWSYAPGTTVN
ncbi:MAG: glycoside hydrolase family 16 protein [Thermoleophilaceae bacterium]|nr:glycoside hydrolase family 16 protein [Thermoleophilaceae bacterium]